MLLVGLQAAARDGRVGETIALGLVALGPGGPGGADPLALGTTIAALRQVGLGRDARLVALDAAAQRAIATP